MRSADELTARFRALGRRVTPQREAIFRILEGASDHPSAEAVHAEARALMPSISLKTIYQALHELEELGEVSALELGTGAARFDPTTGPHHHLVCSSCGAVRDVAADLQVALPRRAAQGFSVSTAEVVFRGTCPSCRAASHTPPARAGTARGAPERAGSTRHQTRHHRSS